MGRIALVTGASRGIGLAIAEELITAGVHVVRLARSISTRLGERRTDFTCDVTSEPEVRTVVARLMEAVGIPDIVVNNAGTFMLKPLAETTTDELESNLRVNLTGPFMVLRELLPHLIKKDWAHIITVGSVADHVPFSGNAAYGASKYGLRGLHEVLARELQGTDVRTTLISPGPTDTGLWDELGADGKQHVFDRADMLRAEDIAQAVLFAVSLPARANVDLIRISPAG
ncbi:MAG: SDR family oxidoreductase [Gemmatimonadota bacterium]|nr:MAG: SDR family oxidoreductase [Gemmatimonadota bacterium]